MDPRLTAPSESELCEEHAGINNLSLGSVFWGEVRDRQHQSTTGRPVDDFYDEDETHAGKQVYPRPTVAQVKSRRSKCGLCALGFNALVADSLSSETHMFRTLYRSSKVVGGEWLVSVDIEPEVNGSIVNLSTLDIEAENQGTVIGVACFDDANAEPPLSMEAVVLSRSHSNELDAARPRASDESTVRNEDLGMRVEMRNQDRLPTQIQEFKRRSLSYHVPLTPHPAKLETRHLQKDWDRVGIPCRQLAAVWRTSVA